MERFIRIPITHELKVIIDKKYPYVIEVHDYGCDKRIIISCREALKLAELIKDIVNDDGQIDFDRVKKQG